MKKIFASIMVLFLIFVCCVPIIAENATEQNFENDSLIFDDSTTESASVSTLEVELTEDDIVQDATIGSIIVQYDASFDGGKHAETVFSTSGITVRKTLGVATGAYNCHYYAWVSQDIDADVMGWVPAPENHENFDYYSLVQGDPQIGDIVCYYKADNTSESKWIHSGIVVDIIGSDTSDPTNIIVQSKWGQGPLYEHRGDQCSYYLYETNVTLKYYRLIGHYAHTFTYSSDVPTQRSTKPLRDGHAKICTGCGVTIWEDHFEFSYVFVSTDTHNIDCACGHFMGAEAHYYSIRKIDDDLKHAMQCICGHISSYIDHTFHYMSPNASTHIKCCTECYYSLEELHFSDVSSAVNNGETHTLTCVCNSATVTEEHTYEACVPIDDELHKDTCICGSFITAEHNLVATSMDPSYHTVSCEECGYEVESAHAFSYTSLGSQTHRRTCTVCGDFYDEDHDLNMVVEYDAAEHTVKCACNYQITQGHIRMDYTATSHTGECRVCDHVSYTNETHTIVYSNNGDGTHTRACTGCEYSVTELHDCVYTPVDIYGHDVTCTYCSYAAEDQTHSWDDGYDAEGNYYNYCMQCGYESDYVPMTAEMIAALSLEEQRALMQSIQTANSDFVLYLDAERGVLYQDGVCYLFYVPANVEVSVYLQPIDLATTQPVYPLPEVTE